MHREASYDRARAQPFVKQEPRNDAPRRRDEEIFSGYFETRPESTNTFARHSVPVKEEEPNNGGQTNRPSDYYGSQSLLDTTCEPNQAAASTSSGGNLNSGAADQGTPSISGAKEAVSGQKRSSDEMQRPQQPTRGYKVEPLITKRRSSQ
jgi:hypothetical protein